jgi:hypothetical protein
MLPIRRALNQEARISRLSKSDEVPKITPFGRQRCNHNHEMNNDVKSRPDTITTVKMEPDLPAPACPITVFNSGVKIIPLRDVTEEEWQAVWPRIPAKSSV